MNKYAEDQEKTSPIRFESELFEIGSWTLLRLPGSASAELPSRGIVCVEGTVNDISFREVLEPDGKGSHWFRVDKKLSEASRLTAGDTVTVVIRPSKDWPEPEIPEDLKKSIEEAPQVNALWTDITPLARWDWVRWIKSTKNPETRNRRIETACDKLGKGERRPCCFNRNLCTEPSISHNGILMGP